MSETKILGLSGKKQSGKNTAGNYVVGVFLKALKVVNDFHISDKGLLIVDDIFGNEAYKNGVLDLNSKDPKFLEFAEENIFPFVKLYSFADLLKQKVCVDILGLTWEQCYGTDEQKMSLTHLKWPDMPGYEEYITYKSDHPVGLMTARDVMQFVGTEIFRKMYSKVWIDGTIRQIRKDSPTMAIVTDVRFPDEVVGIQDVKDDLSGKVGRLTRDIFKGQDQHESETALDNFSQDKYDFLLGGDLSIKEQNKALHQYLTSIKWMPHEVPTELLERFPIQ